MDRFAALLDRLAFTPQRSVKLKELAGYLRDTPDPDRGWALAAVTRELSFPAAKPATLRALVGARMDETLFALSYDFVGDLAETIALVWPARAGANRPPSLAEVAETLAVAKRAEAAGHLERWLDGLDANGRWALLKLVTGGFRVGVSARLAKQALADFGERPVIEIEELWHALAPPYENLFAWLEGRADKPVSTAPAPFRPVMLAHALIDKASRGSAADAALAAAISPETHAAEWKWDGVRVQAVSENGARRLYTRTGEDISAAFPDVLAAMTFAGALDGELLVRAASGAVAPFNALQQRLNRKTVAKRDLAERPAFVRVYDLLVADGEDLRALSLRERRARLEAFMPALAAERFDLSELVGFESFGELCAHRANPPAPEIEGLMLKRWDSAYLPGRPKGPWFKWKRDPFLIDAVLMYAQRGHGRRSSYFSDFTFGVWRRGEDGDALTPVGKAYFGFTDEELKRLDKYVRDHVVERYGPVHAVAANAETGLVLEVAFEGLQRSSRHKSGLAMRFARISRVRWDKPAAEADRLEALEALLAER